MSEPQHIYYHPAYQQGQLLATQQMIQALAEVLNAAPEWSQRSTERIQRLRDSMLNTPSSEVTLHALDVTLAWLAKGATPPG